MKTAGGNAPPASYVHWYNMTNKFQWVNTMFIQMSMIVLFIFKISGIGNTRKKNEEKINRNDVTEKFLKHTFLKTIRSEAPLKANIMKDGGNLQSILQKHRLSCSPYYYCSWSGSEFTGAWWIQASSHKQFSMMLITTLLQLPVKRHLSACWPPFWTKLLLAWPHRSVCIPFACLLNLVVAIERILNVLR